MMGAMGHDTTRTERRHDIKDVLAATDLVALISEDIDLRKAGSGFAALCPFHDEKTASFTIAPSKGFFHCFGCGAHGDALTWMTAYRRLPFREALIHLAGAAGLDLAPTHNGPTRERKAKRTTAEVEAALSTELHVLAGAVSARVASREIPKALFERYPHIARVPDEPWEREYEAARRIAKALFLLYGVKV